MTAPRILLICHPVRRRRDKKGVETMKQGVWGLVIGVTLAMGGAAASGSGAAGAAGAAAILAAGPTGQNFWRNLALSAT